MKTRFCYKCSEKKVTWIVCYTVCTALVWVFCIFSLLYFRGPNYQIPSQRNWLSWAAFVHDILTFSFSRIEFFFNFLLWNNHIWEPKVMMILSSFLCRWPTTLEKRKWVRYDISSYDKGRLLNGAAGAEKNRDCNCVWVIAMTHKLWLITYSYCRWAAR